MGFKHCSIVILAITFCFYGISESRGVNQGPVDPSVIDSLVQNPNVRDNILNAIFQNQGTSVSQVEDVINNSGGDVNQAVNGINSVIREKLLNVQGGEVRVNPEAIRNIVRNTIQASIRDRLANNPALASDLQNSVDQQIEAAAPQLDAAVAQNAVPVEVAQRALTVERRKRSLEPRDGLVQGIVDLVVSIVRDQLGGLLAGLLGSVKNLLSGLIIVVAPGNPIGDLLAGVVNFVIKGLLQVITVVEQLLTVPQTAARRRRDIGDVVGGVVDDVTGEVGGLLDVIVRPVLTLLANLLTPVNQMIKGLVGGIGGLLQPVLGSLIITRINNVVNAIVDLLIPANPL